MSEVVLPKAGMIEAVAALGGRYRVYGPVREGGYHVFGELRDPARLDLEFLNTRLSPKGLFYPQSERMFEFSLAAGDPEAGVLEEAAKDFGPRVIMGIRPCDARALRLVDANFITPECRDPWWARRREATLLVGLACNRVCAGCFCTSVGTGPFESKDLDVMLVDLGSGYRAEGITAAGRELVSELAGTEPAGPDLAERVAALKKAAEEQITKRLDLEPLREMPAAEIFSSPVWEEVQFACLNCGVCTYLCPTCWCFDIQDEVHGERGERLRIWDSCMYPLFTLHGSGHNPRSHKVQRVRQRFMHKLKYYVDKYGDGVACVGCGRCVEYCPVNIDIRRVIERLGAAALCRV